MPSGLLAKFCNKFETCQWFLRRDFKLGFNAMSGCMIFNSLQYLSNSPLVVCWISFAKNSKRANGSLGVISSLFLPL